MSKQKDTLIRIRRIAGTKDAPVPRITAISVTNAEGTKYETIAFDESKDEFQVPAHVARQLTDTRTPEEVAADPRAEYKMFYFTVAESTVRLKTDDELSKTGAASQNNRVKRETPVVSGTEG